MAKTQVTVIKEFYGGIVRDEKSRTRGAALNVEEMDIFSNADYMRAEQIMTSDSMPASTEVYAYTADEDDVVWGYGKDTGDNSVRLVKVTTGGADNPGAFATQFTSDDTTDIAYAVSPIKFLRRDDGDFLYYCTNASGTVKLKSFAIATDTESETDSGSTAMTLTKLDGSFDRISMRVLFGELLITNGQYISKVDKDGVFTEAAFTLPNGWEAVDITEVSDVAIILARSVNRLTNECKGFWWDLTSSLQVDDSFDIPTGGPQWIDKFKEIVTICCAQNGKMQLYQLSGAFPGAVPIRLPNEISNVAAETSTQPISPSKGVDRKDGVLYFTLNKTDKTGIYALGQLDANKPLALILSKRFDTSDYSNHSPYALLIQGPNYYAAFDDNGTADNSRCESSNSPARSSNAVYESVYIDADDPTVDKTIKNVFVTTQPLAASTDVNVYIEKDYGSFGEITRADGTSLNTTSAVMGAFRANHVNCKVWRVKLALSSNSTNSPIITSIGTVYTVDDLPAFK